MMVEKTTTIRYRLVKSMVKRAGWEHEPAVPDWEAQVRSKPVDLRVRPGHSRRPPVPIP